ncbi:ParB family protein [Sinomonas terrae]|uniref:ParB-like C-terminal domain-containing protein n=1 Tax=Sinomonas terrae TaxID=2908838 RepID=A0ABS9U6Y9_9MICC|nr:hypothetical protein [Sinomonas terrae]MCH6472454.1 hypothetical protein [Sinomonas terrae]
MSENRPALSLPPRDPSKVRNLLRSNRPTIVPDPPAAAPEIEDDRRSVAGREVDEVREEGSAPKSRRAQVTFYMDAEFRDRARAAYRATAGIEGDDSWSEFIELAVLNEVTRRERLHNAGEKYEGSSRRLKAGRKIVD